jgi:ATP-binding cassette subfamily B protein
MPPYLTAVRCLFLVTQHHNIQVAPEKMLAITERDSLESMLSIVREAGLEGRIRKWQKWDYLTSLGTEYPVMAETNDGRWVIVACTLPAADRKVDITILDPAKEWAGVVRVSQATFEQSWTGRLIEFKRTYHLTDETQPFGLRWFMPEIICHGRFLVDIAVGTMTNGMLSFAMPLFFNIVVDKVLPNQSYQSLYALIAMYLLVVVIGGFLSFHVQYTTIFSSNKIDSRLLSRSFETLMRLPMQFFEKTTVGTITYQIHMAASVRNFLTGRLFDTALMMTTLPLMLVGLGFYSLKLTLVVLLFSAAIAAITILTMPIFRKQLMQLAESDGMRQSELVETVHCLRALKSLALEPLRMKSWDSRVARVIRSRQTVGHTAIIIVVLTGVLKNLLVLTILGLGTNEVISGHLSLGGLIAFILLQGRVSGPLTEIVSLYTDYQQTMLSLDILSKMMNHPPERDKRQRGIAPPLDGRVAFQQVSFFYEGGIAPALNQVSFTVEPGQRIGVVGRSGSGKTTVTRLIQGINVPQQGTILLGGHDIRTMDLRHLRRNVGIVLQDNILFRGTIIDNIAAGKPASSLDEIMAAAQLAGAAEFIDRLPHSYETVVEEGGTNFSGGQRQRLAIARALLPCPPLLIFDEATSALDPESEVIIQGNLVEIGRGRTMIVVSHRLSSLVDSDAILVLNQGSVVDFAPHGTLLGRCEIYHHLWHQQTQHIRR